MKQLFLSYLYKLRHDIAFKITLIIGGGLALFLTLIYFGLSFLLEAILIDGPSMLISSLSPVQNFGLAVPINLITFTVLEFNQGSIRNKIIAGHSKAKIYTMLFINGLVFTFALMILYCLLNFGLGSLVGELLKSMKPEFEVISASYADFYLLKMIILAIVSYISIVSFTIFFATLFRNIGPTIPVIIIGLLICYLAGTIVSIASDNETVVWLIRILDPLYGIGASESIEAGTIITPYGPQAISKPTILTETFVCSIASNLVYASIFYVLGVVIFSKRDVK